MNEELERKILRQLKLLNTWVTIFGTLLLIVLAGIGFVLFQAAMFVKSTGDRISNFEQTTTQKLDIKAQVCGGTDTFSTFIKNNTDACQ